MEQLVRANTAKEPTEELIEAWMNTFACDRDEALRKMAEEMERVEIWINDLYQIEVRRYPETELVQLNIRRRDGNVIFRDWRHFQEIKNQLVGPECEAVELYPAESRLVDTSNKYHLWCVTTPGFRFPFGWQNRDVTDNGSKVRGLRQRPFPKNKRTKSNAQSQAFPGRSDDA